MNASTAMHPHGHQTVDSQQLPQDFVSGAAAATSASTDSPGEARQQQQTINEQEPQVQSPNTNSQQLTKNSPMTNGVTMIGNVAEFQHHSQDFSEQAQAHQQRQQQQESPNTSSTHYTNQGSSAQHQQQATLPHHPQNQEQHQHQNFVPLYCHAQKSDPPEVSYAPVLGQPKSDFDEANSARRDSTLSPLPFRTTNASPFNGPTNALLSSTMLIGFSEQEMHGKFKRSKKDAKWLQNYELLQQYKQQHGDCIVPRGYTANPQLASWVAEQRKQYKLLHDGRQSSITTERISMLVALDFAWNAQEAAWDRNIHDLRAFKAKHGHCHVPLNHPEFPKLGLWAKEQRRHYALMKQGKPTHMTPQRTVALNALGFCWDTHEAAWFERLRQLADYRIRFGDCMVPAGWSENPKLSTWVHHQRRQYKRKQAGKDSHITDDRIRMLDEIGFCWNARDKSTDNENESNNTTGSQSEINSFAHERAKLPGRPEAENESNELLDVSLDHSPAVDVSVAVGDKNDSLPIRKRKKPRFENEVAL